MNNQAATHATVTSLGFTLNKQTGNFDRQSGDVLITVQICSNRAIVIYSIAGKTGAAWDIVGESRLLAELQAADLNFSNRTGYKGMFSPVVAPLAEVLESIAVEAWQAQAPSLPLSSMDSAKPNRAQGRFDCDESISRTKGNDSGLEDEPGNEEEPGLFFRLSGANALMGAVRAEQRRQSLVRATRRRLETGLRVQVYLLSAIS